MDEWLKIGDAPADAPDLTYRGHIERQNKQLGAGFAAVFTGMLEGGMNRQEALLATVEWIRSMGFGAAFGGGRHS